MLEIEIKDEIRVEIAGIIVRAAEELFKDLKAAQADLFIFQTGDIIGRLEKPKKPEMGNFALPLFELAKKAKLNPAKACGELAEIQNRISAEEYDNKYQFTATGPFNNCRIKTSALAEKVIGEILDQGSSYGDIDFGKGGTVVLDYSSPNIAKPFGIAHLRTTAIGHSLSRIFAKLGYKPVGINHLGDWGTQFGKLIVAFRKWGDETELEKAPIRHLFDLYVRYHKEEEGDSSLADESRAAFKALEEGDEEAFRLWKKFRDYSITKFEEIYNRLGIKFDHYWGEAHYNEAIPGAVERLEKAGLLEESQGAVTVNLKQFDLPPCLIKKSDGATLYATRDIAAVFYRFDKLEFEKALYVVGSAQRDHFRQVFKVIDLLDQKEGRVGDKAIAPRLEHVEFGWVKLNDQMMSTRKGEMILLSEVLDRAVELAREKIAEKNPDLKKIDETAEMIGVGAVMFVDLATRRQRDVNFSWEEILSFEGETGPYLQYTHARMSSLIRKYGLAKKEKRWDTPAGQSLFDLLDSPEENILLSLLNGFKKAIAEAGKTCEPYIICSYLLEVSSAFNKVYQQKDSEGRIVKIISDDPELTAAKMQLVQAVRIVIKEGLRLLGINAPEEM